MIFFNYVITITYIPLLSNLLQYQDQGATIGHRSGAYRREASNRQDRFLHTKKLTLERRLW
jgi:hypothetical protein